MILIGIGDGGTNTDAVVIDGTQIIAGVKSATTPDVIAALSAV